MGRPKKYRRVPPRRRVPNHRKDFYQPKMDKFYELFSKYKTIRESFFKRVRSSAADIDQVLNLKNIYFVENIN